MMSVPFLAAMDIEELISGIISLVIFVVILANALRLIARKARAEQETQEQEPAEPEQGDTQQRQQQRPRVTQADEIQSFLNELARRTGMPAPPKPREAPPQAVQQPAPPPLARPGQPMPEPVRAKRRVVKRVAAVPQDERQLGRISQRHLKSRLREERLRGPSEKRPRYVPPEAKLPQAARQPAAEPAAQLESLLPKDPLKRAIVLREILGPCRTQNPFRPMGW